MKHPVIYTFATIRHMMRRHFNIEMGEAFSVKMREMGLAWNECGTTVVVVDIRAWQMAKLKHGL